MAHTYDANKNTLARGRSTSGRDITITTPSGCSVIVLAICVGSTSTRTGGAPTVTSGGSGTFTQADQVRSDSAETNTELWYLLSPPIGALTVHIPDDNNLYFSADIASFSAASGSSSLRSANGTNGSSTNPACPQLTGLGTGDVLVAISSDGDSNYAPTGRTGTALYEVDDGAYGHASQYYITPNTNNVTMSWTFGTSATWTAIVAAFMENPRPNITQAGLVTEVSQVSVASQVDLLPSITDNAKATEERTVEVQEAAVEPVNISTPVETGLTTEVPQVQVEAQVDLNVPVTQGAKTTEEIQNEITLPASSTDSGKATEAPQVSVASQPDLTVPVTDQGKAQEEFQTQVQAQVDLPAQATDQEKVTEVPQIGVASQPDLTIPVTDQAKVTEDYQSQVQAQVDLGIPIADQGKVTEDCQPQIAAQVDLESSVQEVVLVSEIVEISIEQLYAMPLSIGGPVFIYEAA